jgi:hypothetical protein
MRGDQDPPAEHSFTAAYVKDSPDLLKKGEAERLSKGGGPPGLLIGEDQCFYFTVLP